MINIVVKNKLIDEIYVCRLYMCACELYIQWTNEMIQQYFNIFKVMEITS